MPKRKFFLLSGIVVFFLFIVLTFLVRQDLFTSLDFDTTVRLQDNLSRRVDEPFSFFSDIGKFEIVSIVLVLIFLLTKRFKAGIIAGVLYIVFHAIELVGKHFLYHPPPPQFMLRTQDIFQFPEFTIREINSYPSGHAGRAMFASVILLTLLWQSKRFGQGVKIFISGLIVGFVIVMVISRVYLGEHWVSDIIGGSLLGGALGLFAGMFLLPTAKHA